MFARKNLQTLAFAVVAMAGSQAAAGTIPHPIMNSPYGGLVVDAQGLNDQRLVSVTDAEDLNKGAPRGDPELNDFFIGQQDGFTTDLLDQLGGGFSSFSVRLTVYDGDNDPGNFDDGDNYLRVNDIIFGSFSDVITTTTDEDGNMTNGLHDGVGFGDDETDTGVFTLTETSALAALFASMQQTNSLFFEIDKRDENGNFFDFTTSSRVPGAGTSLSPTLMPVPLPAGMLLLLSGIGGLGMLRRRKTA